MVNFIDLLEVVVPVLVRCPRDHLHLDVADG